MTTKITTMRYRAKGLYTPTNKRSYITTKWRNTKAQAQEDIELYGRDYTNIEIVEIDFG